MNKIFTYLFCFYTLYATCQTTQTFISSGSFTVPLGVTSILVEAWGAGGAGGSAVGNNSPQFRAMAGGGGGGAYVSGTIIVTPGQVISYTVAPNTGQNSSISPLNGGSSIFSNIIAPGGSGGICVNAGTAGSHIGGAGGAGGIGTQNGGKGGSRIGYDGMVSGRVGAGGGGGAGSIGSGTNGSDDQTSGSAGIGGAGGGGAGDSGQMGTGDGAGGSIIGGGGSGAWAAASTTFRNGGPGARGQIKITYTVLPIKIKQFDVSKQNFKSRLKLITASETNNDYFTIERAADGQDFSAIGMIDGAGNSNSEINYEFTDEKPLDGINYYRIKQTDFDGQYSYSDIRSVRFSNLGGIQVSPRTTEGKLNITTDLHHYVVTIVNASGQSIRRFVSMSLDQTISIEDLHAGLYFVRVSSGSESETIKVIKI